MIRWFPNCFKRQILAAKVARSRSGEFRKNYGSGENTFLSQGWDKGNLYSMNAIWLEIFKVIDLYKHFIFKDITGKHFLKR